MSDNGDQPDEDVDLDLDLVGDSLRAERVGRPTTVKVNGEVIHINHAASWSTAAMRAASLGDWDTWAEEVINNKEEYGAWIEANLENFEVEAVFQECGRRGRMTMGKSIRPSGSRKHSRKS